MAKPSTVTSPVGRRNLWILIVILAIFVPFVYSAVSFAISDKEVPSEVFLERPDSIYTECVKDTEYMRYHHWELLRAIREDVVRYGIRGDIGLKSCGTCHTSRERFCNRCHDAVSLKPDCFECHYYE